LVDILIPKDLRKRIRVAYRHYVFRRAVRRLRKLPPGRDPSTRLLRAFVYGWDNEAFSAGPDFLGAAYRYARADGPILECGSGLSTILLGLAAQRRGGRVWSLEHDPVWVDRVRAVLEQLQITSVEVIPAPLRKYDEYRWYETP